MATPATSSFWLLAGQDHLRGFRRAGVQKIDEVREYRNPAGAETFLRGLDIDDPIDAELSEILPETTPGKQYRHPLQIDDRQRQHLPVSPLLPRVHISVQSYCDDAILLGLDAC